MLSASGVDARPRVQSLRSLSQTMEFGLLVDGVAAAFTKADSARPVWVSRSGREYRAGIGPHAEDAAVALMLAELRSTARYALVPSGQFLPYPDAPRQKCDVWLGDPVEWVLEVKMARFKGDNGKVDDTAIKDLISPYGADRSALTDVQKLAHSGFPSRKAILIYGFEFTDRPLEPAISAFEALARERVGLGDRRSAAMGPLVHPVHSTGVVFGWEVAAA